MQKSKWMITIGMLVLLSGLLPYTVLSGIYAWYGSFLLWLVMGAAIILANLMLTRNWEDE